MITASVTTTIHNILATLKPVEKWNAVRQLDTSVMTERWFILAGLVTIIILTLLLIAVSYHRRMEERRISNRRFFEQADKLGLTRMERQILQDIASRVDLRTNVSIFSMIEAFDRGVSRIIEDTLALQGIEASKRLSPDVSALRQKLGFEKQSATSLGSAKQSSRPTSRQIPTGKKLYLTYPDANDLVNIDSVLIKNDNVNLTIKLDMPLQRRSGEICCVRYCFGGSVWEFDSTVVSYQDNMVILTHSDNVRFINRRRFLRVPVSKPAFITHFPFLRTVPANSGDKVSGKTDLNDADENVWGTLDLVPAVVTELAGPGLRIEAPLEVTIGERILIIFQLNEESHQEYPTPDDENTRQSITEQKKITTPFKIVEDIGEIRHTEAIEDGFSTGLELTGLSDSDVNELIRATNAASMKAKADTQDTPASDIEGYEQTAPEPVFARGT